jgi:hypothetical protein
VSIHHTATFIQDVLEKKLGKVARVDLLPKIDTRGKVYQVAFVHFETWQDSAYAKEIQKNVASKEAPRFYYNDYYYWILLENQSIRRIPGERKPTLQLDLDALKHEPSDHEPLRYTRMYKVGFASKMEE